MSEKIGKYTLEKKIGEGGYGICYKAKDEKNNLYAIKKIKVSSYEDKEKVQNEINNLRAMISKYSVNIIESIPKDIDEIREDSDVYIVMELCDGDLSDLLDMKNGNLDIVTIIKIMNQLNEVLKLMHYSNNIEHRDLKPENILIKYINENDFEIKLTDYGCSKEYEIYSLSKQLEENQKDSNEKSSENDSKFRDFIGTDYYRAQKFIKIMEIQNQICGVLE